MKHRRTAFALLLTAALFGASPQSRESIDRLGIVPLPASVVLGDGSFPIPERWQISTSNPTERDAASFFVSYQHRRSSAAGFAVEREANLRLHLEGGSAFPREGYALRIDPAGVTIDASTGAGLFYGIQTLEELLESQRGSLPAVTIVDAPRFPWRGIHLDVSRHFFSVAAVERYIDVAAHYKLNTFHWHLTDDQGWRLQILRYPRLTSVGSCRKQTESGNDATEFDGKRYCGYYTQAQVRNVVRYAAARHVTIVPEIEMPGHADASVAAYPQLACGAPQVGVRETWGVSHELICPTDTSFAFIDNVLREVTGLFPGRYVHIGGDETPKDQWERSRVVRALMEANGIRTYDGVQGYFDRRVEAMLKRYHRKMVGWDEILDGGVSSTATVMSWRGESGGIRAARRGNDVVMTPDGPLYFDAYQGDPNDEPLAIDNFTRLQDVYAFSPVPAALSPSAAAHVIGVQGNAWSEYIETESHLFYMVLPRELALAEIAWAPSQTHNWESFEQRTEPQYAWLQRTGTNFRIPNPTISLNGATAATFDNVGPSVRTVAVRVQSPMVEVTMRAPVPDASIRYTLDGTTPTSKSMLYTEALRLQPSEGSNIILTAITVLSNGRESTPSQLMLAGGAALTPSAPTPLP